MVDVECLNVLTPFHPVCAGRRGIPDHFAHCMCRQESLETVSCTFLMSIIPSELLSVSLSRTSDRETDVADCIHDSRRADVADCIHESSAGRWKDSLVKLRACISSFIITLCTFLKYRIRDVNSSNGNGQDMILHVTRQKNDLACHATE